MYINQIIFIIFYLVVDTILNLINNHFNFFTHNKKIEIFSICHIYLYKINISLLHIPLIVMAHLQAPQKKSQGRKRARLEMDEIDDTAVQSPFKYFKASNEPKICPNAPKKLNKGSIFTRLFCDEDQIPSAPKKVFPYVSRVLNFEEDGDAWKDENSYITEEGVMRPITWAPYVKKSRSVYC